MIAFYKDYFFPADHVDAGKPVPLGLCGQLGSRPSVFSTEWWTYKTLMAELELKGYSSVSRNGDDPIQERLREENYFLTDSRTFEELYRIGLARIGSSAPAFVGWVDRTATYINQAAGLVSAVRSFCQEYQQLRID